VREHMHKTVAIDHGVFRHVGRCGARRGLILPIMLVILLLLALLSASFAFQVQADYSAGRAMSDRLQCRMAAEAGVQRVMFLLRSKWADPDAWYHNPELFDQALVWSPDAAPEDIGKPELLGDNARYGQYAFRFSIIADDPFDDEIDIRFGITDEASKLNINTASAGQLMRLISPLVPEGVEPAELVAALLDWRDQDNEPQEAGAESEYYQSLPVPYRAKNAPFDTVEELLLVRGFTGQILYGEDYDRNGLLTTNEDDGELSFPFDNGDGVLNRGLLSYVTVYSQEYNVSNDNQQRVNLFGKEATVREGLEEIEFESDGVVDFIIGATRQHGTEVTLSLADYLQPRIVHNTLTESPIRGNDVATFFDRCTLDATPERRGLINVVTAPPLVLRCIEGLPEEAIELVVQKRAALAGPIKATTAWLVTEEILTPADYAEIQNQITGRSRQFTVESIGFADHSGVYCRLQVIVNMRGPLAQTVYYRDLTKLGLAFPIRGEEGERSLVLQTE